MAKQFLLSCIVVALGVFAIPYSAGATTITFEGFAPAGGLVNLSPASPYTEAGFTLRPGTTQAAVFDSAAAVDFPGDATDFLGFAERNLIVLTGPAPFTLNSVLLGPITLANGPLTTINVTGFINGGGTMSATFTVTTATLETFNWSNLEAVTFLAPASDDSGLDNITVNEVNAVPEPASVVLFTTGGLGLIARMRKRRT